jgi:hypothetical protein
MTSSGIGFDDFTETPPDSALPWLDRAGVDESNLTAHQREWRRDGVVTLRNYLPDEVLAPYIARRAALPKPGGWLTGSAYMHILELRDLALYPPLMALLAELLGAPMMLHLALTGWVTTKRDWHQDDYLNPPHVNSWYAAIWVALDDIDPDSGPFEYVPGSHMWPLMRGHLVRAHLAPDEAARTGQLTGDAAWPKVAERFTTPAIEAEIARRQAPVIPFIGRRGDVLVWHSRLMHRGAVARVKGMERKSVICHYTAAGHHDLVPGYDQNGQMYAIFDRDLVA